MRHLASAISLLSVLAMASFNTACSVKADSPSANPNPIKQTVPPAPTPGPSVNSVSLNGQWLTGCSVIPGMSPTMYETVAVTINGNQFSTTANVYGKSDCATTLFPPSVETGTFVLGNVNPYSNGAYDFDCTMTPQNGPSYTNFDVILIQSDRFFLPAPAHGASAGSRVVSIDMTTPFIKQP